MTPSGFLRTVAISTTTSIANPRANSDQIYEAVLRYQDADIIVFPELTLSGYTCGELFGQSILHERCKTELLTLAKKLTLPQLVVVGLPWVWESKLYNCAAVLNQGRILGLVPKQFLPTYQEFYEGRWFQSGASVQELTLTSSDLGIDLDYAIPFGTDLLFQFKNAIVGIEICEDLWVPIAPSSLQAVAGANILINLSASNETIGKAAYRQRLVTTQSGKCIAGYVYASAGPTESTTDLVFGGHCMIAENGTLLSESQRVGTGLRLNASNENDRETPFAISDIDLGRLEHDRQQTGTIHQTGLNLPPFRKIPFALRERKSKIIRKIDPHPFVPKETAELELRCDEVFEIQIAGLAKRVQTLPDNIPLVIGVSGGLDSTLALIVAAKMFEGMGWNPKRLVGITMPGFGTSAKTKGNAIDLMKLLGITSEVIDIRASCFQIFQNLQHKPFGVSLDGKDWNQLQHELEQLPEHERIDLIFENVQARMRTLLLMSRGFVIGTGDLSECALGWSTYNADHMSMYNVNCSVPKTLVRFLVRHVADKRFHGEIRRVLLDISDTPISPELLPLTKDREILQNTESTVGPYELHDFFLYHFVRTGAAPQKILELAYQAEFDTKYDEKAIEKWLRVFLSRFFQSQFKRTCVPDGPKVGTVSLSPRGDWRMPSDADPELWKTQL